jgi:hypothetical protein
MVKLQDGADKEGMTSFPTQERSFKNAPFCVALTIYGILMVTIVATVCVDAQSSNKTVSFQPSKTFMAPQITINEVRVGDDLKKVNATRFRDAYLTEPVDFKAGSDWLSRTSFQLENVSGKQIVYLTINLRFPETTVSGPIMLYPISFGRRPGSKVQNAEPFLLKPDGSLDLPLGPKYPDISRFVGNRHSIEFINQIQLEVGFIVFADGTAWMAGQFMRQDPDNPNRYIPIQTDSSGN